MDWPLRLARGTDIPALRELIERSVRNLQAAFYSTAQMEGALGSVFGVDRQLIRDQTYFVVEQERVLLACGGWSKRASLFGSDHDRAAEDALLDPRTSSARVRAFFVHADYSRRGLGRTILLACEEAMEAAHFSSAELVATLPGVAFYRAFGYEPGERYEVPLANGLRLPVVKMGKKLNKS